MEKVAKEIIPANSYKYRWSGMSYQEQLAGNKVLLIFIASFVFIYLFLVAQYESWVLVLAVMMAIPIAVLGAMAALLIVSDIIPLINNNLFAQVGIVLLFGLSTKTAILIVEFAKHKHEAEGMSIVEAAKYASGIRLRAVLMTGISFILGTFPLVIAMGAGAMSMKSIGIVIFGGMIVAIILNTMMIPAFYALMARIAGGKEKKEKV
jgi:HAE1 family hydrophobic/amphiphilic exporter-1